MDGMDGMDGMHVMDGMDGMDGIVISLYYNHLISWTIFVVEIKCNERMFQMYESSIV